MWKCIRGGQKGSPWYGKELVEKEENEIQVSIKDIYDGCGHKINTTTNPSFLSKILFGFFLTFGGVPNFNTTNPTYINLLMEVCFAFFESYLERIISLLYFLSPSLSLSFLLLNLFLFTSTTVI